MTIGLDVTSPKKFRTTGYIDLVLLDPEKNPSPDHARRIGPILAQANARNAAIVALTQAT